MKEGGKMVAFLGEGTLFEGTLKFSGTVRLDGRFKGSIESDGTLIVGPKGILNSEINVGALISSGEIHGQVNASKRIEIHAPGRVFGTLQAPTIAIAKGALFEGETRMQAATGKNPPPASKEKPAGGRSKKPSA